jgi:hypothetical protein
VTFSDTEPDAQDLKEIAAQRWKAVEAFLRLPTGLEARLGAKLVAAMNGQTRVCMPSEVRLIAELGCSRRGLQQAKASLRQQGLIDWQTPVGPRGGAMYQFNFEALKLLHEENKRKADKAVTEQRERNLASPYYTARRVFKAKANPSAPIFEPQCAINPGDSQVKAHSETLQGAFSDTPKRIFEQSIANPSAQDITLNLTHRTLPFYHADHFAIGGDEEEPTVSKPEIGGTALAPTERLQTTPKKQPRFYLQSQFEKWGFDETSIQTIAKSGRADEIARTIAMRGIQASRALLTSLEIQIPQPEQK